MTETVIITGCSSGIGYKTAELAAAKGHRVIATAPTPALAEKVPVAAALKLVLDVCDPASVAHAVAEATEKVGPLTCLVNNAGYCQPGPIELVSDEQVLRQFEVNVFGAMRVARAVLPGMRARGGGRIINLCSMMGRMTSPFLGVYCASKYALESVSDALRMEVCRFGIDVAVIEPGWVRTNFLQTATDLTPAKWTQEGPYAEQLTSFLSQSQAAERGEGKHRIAGYLSATPDLIAERVVHVMETQHPKARYPVTMLARVVPWLGNTLPTSLWDSMQRRSYGA